MFIVLTVLSFVQRLNTTDLFNVDFYKILGLEVGASQRDIKRAFKRFMGQKQRNKAPSDRTLRLWKQTETAYEVLSNPSSRELYDFYGINFLNYTGFNVYGYQSDAQIRLLRNIYNSIPSDIEEMGGVITYPIQFSLSDFLTGAEKQVRVIQSVNCICPRGGTRCAKCRQNPFMQKLVQHTIELPPGAPELHRILVKGLGDTKSGRGANDVVFIVYCRPDENGFQRDGSDLRVTINVTLGQALAGGGVEIVNVDGEVLTVSIEGSVQDGEERRIIGKGLPAFDEPKKRGDVVVTFRVIFPEKLSEDQKNIVAEILPVDLLEYE